MKSESIYNNILKSMNFHTKHLNKMEGKKCLKKKKSNNRNKVNWRGK